MNKKKIAFYHCHTPLHIGSGTTLDIIDLPIQREAHTDFPVMPSTSIKGVIRGEYWSKILEEVNLADEKEFLNTPDNPKDLKKIFKKIFKLKREIDDNAFENCWKNLEENKNQEFTNCINNFLEEINNTLLEKFWSFREFFELFGFGDKEGDIIFTDGKILLFPVKSVKGVFAWITCPLVLERFERDTGINLEVNNLDIDDKSAIVTGNKIVITGGSEKYLVLEELSFKVKNDENDTIEMLWNNLPQELKDDDIDKEKIAILSNDRFRYFVKNHTEVNARTRIDQVTGTVKEGALWYEELVPAETIFYNLILSRNDNEENLKLISDFIETYKNSIFQFGGDETLGRGFTKVCVKEEK